MWISGNNPAAITAKIVMASAALLMDVRHFCLTIRRKMEKAVPA